MRRYIYIFLFITFSFALEKVGLTKQNIYKNSYAVIIGINRYKNLSKLDYAVNDAKSFKKLIIDKFGYSEKNITLLIDEDASKNNIEQAISKISINAEQKDRIIIFFSGHGETMSLPSGGEMGYLIPFDGTKENLFFSAIPMNDLKYLAEISNAKHMLFLIDACYGGLAAVGTKGLSPSKKSNYLEKLLNIKSRQIITAGGRNEKVIEKPEWGHSAYTMNLIRALKNDLADNNGDGYTTASELGLYLSEKVTVDSENMQTPQIRRLTSHEGEFIFLGDNHSIINDKVKTEKKYFKLLISKVDSDYMHGRFFPPIVARDVKSMIASAPKFIIEEPNFFDDNTSIKKIKDWENLMYILSAFENGNPGDSITTYWNDEYYFKVYINR